MKPLVSVIVPVYNVEKYLADCVISILNQTYDNIEVILINDGSPDYCPHYCDLIARQHNDKVKVVHQENKGLPSARNAGIKVAKGKYIAFCDSDDTMKPEMLQKFVECAEETQAQVVMAGYETFPNGRITLPGIKTNGTIKGIEFADKCSTLHSGNELCFSWRFFILKSYLEEHNLMFNEELLFGEDVPFNISIIMEAERVSIIHEPLYNYRIDNSNSIMRKKYKPNLEKLIEIQYEEKMKLTRKYYLDLNEAWMRDLSYYYITAFAGMLFRNAMNGPEKDKRAAIKRIINMPMMQANYHRYVNKLSDLFIGGRRNFPFNLAFLLRIDPVVYAYVERYYSEK